MVGRSDLLVSWLRFSLSPHLSGTTERKCSSDLLLKKTEIRRTKSAGSHVKDRQNEQLCKLHYIHLIIYMFQ